LESAHWKCESLVAKAKFIVLISALNNRRQRQDRGRVNEHIRNNYPGNAVLLGLQEDCRYPNLYRETNVTRVLSKLSDKPKVKYGWHTTAQSRNLMLTELKYFIEDEDDVSVEDFSPEYSVYDIDLLKEMLTFVNIDGKYEAEQGKHDDSIIASAIATQMFKKLRPLNVRTSSVGKSGGISIGKTYESTNLY